MKDFCRLTGLHRNTILNLEKKGVIKPLYTPGGQRRFTDEHIKQIYDYYRNKNSIANDKKNVIYARVSTNKQKEFLKNQIKICKEYAISNGIIISEVITDIASSFNFKRKGLLKLLNDMTNYKIKSVIIYDEDRLSRIAFDLFSELFNLYGVEIIIVDQAISEDKYDEITKELISFIHYITSKIYGKRNYKKYLKEICKGNYNEESNENQNRSD